MNKVSRAIPTYYFTQLLAVAMGLGPEASRFDLNEGGFRGVVEK